MEQHKVSLHLESTKVAAQILDIGLLVLAYEVNLRHV